MRGLVFEIRQFHPVPATVRPTAHPDGFRGRRSFAATPAVPPADSPADARPTIRTSRGQASAGLGDPRLKVAVRAPPQLDEPRVVLRRARPVAPFGQARAGVPSHLPAERYLVSHKHAAHPAAAEFTQGSGNPRRGRAEACSRGPSWARRFGCEHGQSPPRLSDSGLQLGIGVLPELGKLSVGVRGPDPVAAGLV